MRRLSKKGGELFSGGSKVVSHRTASKNSCFSLFLTLNFVHNMTNGRTILTLICFRLFVLCGNFFGGIAVDSIILN